ncbi:MULTISPECIES: hypothetical protein [Lysinibacillus]|uniref:Uncharacterized protein n=1 Tax=Lysinibacillus irui TaxID=2998077 RepID=A0AAJ5USV1_9BACI|nr:MULTISPECIES: hypothetical protein [Lysinibacillus]MEA0564313.1 hypothetical protein [Lysinibacillus irui]WDV06298.1 hypothetical protein OU989_18875 [Lysinibacillus irui]
MKTIYIYPKLAMGFRGFATGLDREGFFLKKRSSRLKKTIEDSLKENNLSTFNVEVTHGYESPEELLENDGVLVLISPYLKSLLSHIDFSKSGYYLLSEEEYNSQNIDNLIKYIKTL